MSVLDKIIGLLAPFDCLGCCQEGSLLCESCRLSLSPAPDNLATTAYKGLAKDLVWRLKYGSSQEAARIIARHMASLVPKSSKVVLVPVPTATSRARRRGYDQAYLLAKELSKQTGLPMLKCLARIGQAHQVGANRQQRLNQLNTAFRMTRSVRNFRIVLIDDVITTGATMQAAAKALKKAGAVEVSFLAFARALN
jgi:ComF family protein